MEHPSSEIEAVIYKLTTGSPRLQQQTLEHYFTPNASFSHPFCAVHASRSQILSIFRWYKVLSPKIKIRVHGLSYDEKRQKLYVDISQTFRIWPFIPLGYRADVNLVTVLQLTRDPGGRDVTAERAAIQEGATPSSTLSSSATTSPFTRDGTEKPAAVLPPTVEPAKYWIKSQTDLYQTNEFAKFVSLLGLLPLLVDLWQVFATWCCVVGAFLFTPFTAAMQRFQDKQVEHRARVRSDASFGPSLGGDMTADERREQRRRDVWELEARFLSGDGVQGDEGLRAKMEMQLRDAAGRNGKSEVADPMLEWMKMERTR